MPRTSGHIKKETRSLAKRKAEFLTALIELISITRAAKKAKVGRQRVYEWIKDDPEFEIAFKDACAIATAKLEDEAIRRANEGTLKPVYQGGVKVGAIREYSDTLLIVLLKARAPEKYKERFTGEITGANGKDLFTEKSDEDLKKLLQEKLSKING